MDWHMSICRARLGLALAAFTGFATVEVMAQQPIPAGPDAYTHAKFMKDQLAYELRVLDSYEKHTADPAELHEAARGLLATDRRLARPKTTSDYSGMPCSGSSIFGSPMIRVSSSRSILHC